MKLTTNTRMLGKKEDFIEERETTRATLSRVGGTMGQPPTRTAPPRLPATYSARQSGDILSHSVGGKLRD